MSNLIFSNVIEIRKQEDASDTPADIILVPQGNDFIYPLFIWTTPDALVLLQSYAKNDPYIIDFGDGRKENHDSTNANNANTLKISNTDDTTQLTVKFIERVSGTQIQLASLKGKGTPGNPGNPGNPAEINPKGRLGMAECRGVLVFNETIFEKVESETLQTRMTKDVLLETGFKVLSEPSEPSTPTDTGENFLENCFNQLPSDYSLPPTPNLGNETPIHTPILTPKSPDLPDSQDLPESPAPEPSRVISRTILTQKQFFDNVPQIVLGADPKSNALKFFYREYTKYCEKNKVAPIKILKLEINAQPLTVEDYPEVYRVLKGAVQKLEEVLNTTKGGGSRKRRNRKNKKTKKNKKFKKNRKTRKNKKRKNRRTKRKN